MNHEENSEVFMAVVNRLVDEASSSAIASLLNEMMYRPEPLTRLLRLVTTRLGRMPSDKRDRIAERVADTCEDIFQHYDGRKRGAAVLTELCEFVSELVADCPGAKVYFKATSLPLKVARLSEECESLGNALRSAASLLGDDDNMDDGEGETRAEGESVVSV